MEWNGCVFMFNVRDIFYITHTPVAHTNNMKIDTKYRQNSNHYHKLLERDLINELWSDLYIVYMLGHVYSVGQKY